MLHPVWLDTCDEYSAELIREKIVAGLAGIGFSMEDFRNRKVVLKPNFLVSSHPDRAIITHPEFFRAVAGLVLENGGRPILVESPAIESARRVIRKGGYRPVIEDLGVEVADAGVKDVLFNPHGKGRYRRFEISRAVFDADIVINLPKLKTHGITHITCSVKNLFGLIPGTNKAQWHTKAQAKHDFADFLLDLNEGLVHGFDKPKRFLHVVDGIVGQEGNGPGPTGTPRKIGVVIIGESPVAVDFVAARVLNMDLEKIPTLLSGFRRNLGPSDPAEVDVRGVPVECVQIADFAPPVSKVMNATFERWPFTTRAFRNWFNDRPVLDPDLCKRCYQCTRICPAGAVCKTATENDPPEFDNDKCIRCFCCMEICPDAAIHPKRGPLQWMIR